MTFNPLLKEESVRIACDFLERSGEIEDMHAVELLMSDTVEYLMQNGVTSRLLLSNLAIMAFQRYRSAQIIDVPQSRKSSWFG